MAKIIWDAAGERQYETGASQAVLYPTQVIEKVRSYATSVPWNGLISFTEKATGGELTDLYADDINYAGIRAAEKFGGTIEAYMCPDEFAACDGRASVATGLSIGQQGRKPFGLVYKTKCGDDGNSDASAGYILHIIYNASASPSERKYSTINESPEAVTLSWEITTVPVAVTGYKPTSHLTIDSRTTVADKLALLENKLFGTANTEPTLLDPDALLALIA